MQNKSGYETNEDKCSRSVCILISMHLTIVMGLYRTAVDIKFRFITFYHNNEIKLKNLTISQWLKRGFIAKHKFGISFHLICLYPGMGSNALDQIQIQIRCRGI